MSTSKGSTSDGDCVPVWGWVVVCSEVVSEEVEGEEEEEEEEEKERGDSGVMSPYAITRARSWM